MIPVDIIIILILLWGAWSGWRAGLIKEIFSTCGFLGGLVVACLLYKTLGEHLTPALGSGSLASYAGCVLAFIIIWVIVPIVCGVFANGLTKAVNAMMLGPVNSLLGLLLGTIKYFLLISFVFSAMSYASILSEEKKEASVLYPYVTIPGNIVLGKTTIAEESGKLRDKTVIIQFDRKSKNKDCDAAGKGE